MRLKDRIALITGAGAGIGRGTAQLFAREGAQVICVDIDGKKAEETVALLGAKRNNSFALQADISSSEQVQRMAADCEKRVPKLDILFNNAGYSVKKHFEETTEEEWHQMLGVHITGTFLCSKYLLPLMKKAGSGAIVNHGSLDAFLGNPNLAAYSVAKGGIIPLTHVMAHDLAKYHIRVNCISSGGIKTGFTSTGHEKRMAVTPVGRAGTPEDIAYTVLFLASDESAYVDGASIVVDGGRSVITPGCF